MEFSKIILVVDYLIFWFLAIVSFFNPEVVMITTAWIAQVGVSTGFYFWKAKQENKVKVPIKILESMPDEYKEQIDLTQIVTTILSNE